MLNATLTHDTMPAKTVRPMRILVIDDNELDRQRVLRLCDRAGLCVDATEAATLDDVRAALDQQSFDLIFIDYLLVGDTGLDAVDLVADHPAQHTATAIMMAGEGQIDVAVEAMRRGCSDFLTKSMLNVDTLQKSIATALERRILFSTLDQERSARQALEQSVRDYADSCTVEMRSILAATLRRVRKLRGYSREGNNAFSADLNSLENAIDRLWDALPAFRDKTNGIDAPPALLTNSR